MSNSIKRRIKIALDMDFFDYVNLFSDILSKMNTRLILSIHFGAMGSNSWIKAPDKIIGAGRIFIGKDVHIEKHAVIYALRRYQGEDYMGRVDISDGTYANRGFNVTSAFHIFIGKKVAFGTNVFLNDFDHSYEDPEGNSIDSPLVSRGGIKIGDRCWIGSNTYIGSGVVLGEKCIVAANSVVTRSFPAYSVLAGAPAKLIKHYDEREARWVSN